MELNAITSALPLIAAIIGIVSAGITGLLSLVRGYRHIRERRRKHPESAVGGLGPVGAAPTTLSPGIESKATDSIPASGPAPGNFKGTREGSALEIRTPDQRLRVFVSSTLAELSDERIAARQAISQLHLTPVLFETGARPHPARSLYRAYLAQSDVFLGIYWQKYGWLAPGEDVSGLEDEYRLSHDKPKLIYLKVPAADREPQLTALLNQIRADDHVSYNRVMNNGLGASG